MLPFSIMTFMSFTHTNVGHEEPFGMMDNELNAAKWEGPRFEHGDHATRVSRGGGRHGVVRASGHVGLRGDQPHPGDRLPRPRGTGLVLSLAARPQAPRLGGDHAGARHGPWLRLLRPQERPGGSGSGPGRLPYPRRF